MYELQKNVDKFKTFIISEYYDFRKYIVYM